MNILSTFFNSVRKPKISWWTDVDGLYELKGLHPQPAGRFIPEYLKKNKRFKIENIGQEVKSFLHCPVISDFLTLGYIIPNWCDTLIYLDDDKLTWETSDEVYKWDYHSSDQFIDLLPPDKQENILAVLRPSNPWKVQTPKGVSLLQMPLSYSFNSDFSILPGIRDTFSTHIINQHILIHKKHKKIFIPRGEPIGWFIPFKNVNLYNKVIRSSRMTKELQGKSLRIALSKFYNGYRKRDQIL